MYTTSIQNIKALFALAALFLLPLHCMAQSKDERKSKYDTKVMKEVRVNGKRQLMTVIKDTVVFDTQALGMSDNTMLGDMMRLLPGIEISDDGKILFNGKEVKRLRLNGRDFFRQSKKVMLENLTSLVVDKIKVYNESPEYAYLYSKIKSKVQNGELTIDVILKKEYRVGLFGHASAAGGHSYDRTDKGVYDANLFGVATTGKSTVGGFANGNNQNRGVSMLKTSMFNKMGNDKGQAASQSLGLNFTHKDGKRNLNFNSTVQMEHGDALLRLYEEEFNSQSFDRWRTNSEKDSRNNKWNVRWNHEQSFKWKSAYFDLKPEIEYTRNRDMDLWGDKQYMQLTSVDTGEDIYLLKYSRNQDTRRNASIFRLYNKSNGHFVLPFHKFPFAVEWEIKYKNTSKDETTEDTYSRTAELRKDILPSSAFENRVKLTNTIIDNKGKRASYSIDLYYCHTYNKETGERERYIDDSRETGVGIVAEGMEDWHIDRDNSFHTTQHSHLHDLGMTLNLTESQGWRMNASLSGQYSHRSIHDMRGNEENSRSLGDFSAGGYLSLQKKSFNLSYLYKEIRPDMLKMLPVRDAGNRFTQYLGNPDLRNTQEHRMNLDYSKNIQVRQQSLSVGAVFKIWSDAVTSAQSVDTETGIITKMPVNMPGNWNATAYASYGCRLDKDGKLRFNASLNFNSDHSVRLAFDNDMRDNVRSAVDNFTMNGRIRLIYGGIKKLNIVSSADVGHRIQNNHMWNSHSGWTDHSYGINLNYTPRRNVSVSTDVMACVHSGYNDMSLNYTEWVWNASASYSFGKKKAWSLAASAYDILHQIRNRRQEVYEQGYKITRYNTLCSYATLSMTYSFNRNPGKK